MSLRTQSEHLFLCLAALPRPFLGLTQHPTVCPFISGNSFNVKFPASITFSTFPVSYFFFNSLYFGFEFQFRAHHLSFLCCTFIFVDQLSLLTIHFSRMSCCSSRQTPGKHNWLHTLLPTQEMNDRCAVTGHHAAVKEVPWLVTVMPTCYSHGELRTREVAVKFILPAIDQLLHSSNWNLNHASGRLVIFNQIIVTRIHGCQNYKIKDGLPVCARIYNDNHNMKK